MWGPCALASETVTSITPACEDHSEQGWMPELHNQYNILAAKLLQEFLLAEAKNIKLLIIYSEQCNF